MNRIYKSVWHPASGTYIVASELAKGRTKSKTVSLMAILGVGATLYSASLLAETITYTGAEALNTITDYTQYEGELFTETTAVGPLEHISLSGNQVTLDFIANNDNVPNIAYGALASVTEETLAENNQLTLHQGAISSEHEGGNTVYGALIYGQVDFDASVTAKNNRVNLDSNFGIVPVIYGGKAVALGRGNASVIGNEVEVTGFTSTRGAYFVAGEAISTQGNSYASNNVLTINHSHIDGSTFPDSFTTLSAASVEAHKAGYISNNKLTINNSDFSAIEHTIFAVDAETTGFQTPEERAGRYMPESIISDNQLTITGSHFGPSSSLATVSSIGEKKSITNNSLLFDSSSLSGSMIAVVRSPTGLADEVSGNNLVIKGSELDNSEISAVISQGYTRKILNNSLTIESSTITNSPDIIGVYVGNNQAGNLTGSTRIDGNKLTLNHSNLTDASAYTVLVSKKGYAYDISNNTLDIIDSTFIGNTTLAPAYYIATVDTSETDGGNLKVILSNNTVRIAGNTTFDANGTHKVYGSYLDLTQSPALVNDTVQAHYAMNNNTVIIDGVSNLSNVDIYGSYIKEESSGNAGRLSPLMRVAAGIIPTTASYYNNIAGNTLAIHSYSDTVTVNSVTNFANYQFYIEGDSVMSQPLLTTHAPVVLDYQTGDNQYQSVGLGITINGRATLAKGDTITPFSQAVETHLTEYQDGKTITIQKGAGAYYDAVIAIRNGEVVTEVTSEAKGRDNSKALVEGQSASLAFVNQGADLITGKGISNALLASSNSSGDAAGFGAISVGSSRYKTGSHVDVDGSSLLVGSAIKKEALLFGAFFEAGWGSYDSRNSFASGSVHGDGDTNYRGGGLISRYDITDSLYLDGSVRLGKASTDFSTHDIEINGEKVRYDSDSLYYGAHIGGGYTLTLDEKQAIELRSQYLWTHQEGDDITTTKDRYQFNGADSHRVRVMAQYSYTLASHITPYAGLGYEYEFDGKSSATISGIKTDETSLQGSTGIIELGAKSTALYGTNLYLDINAKGYLGKREGVQGEFNVIYAF